MIDLSVIIVNYNTQEMLRECLLSLFQEAGGVALQVFVVDNASTDGSAEMVRSEFPGVELISNTANRGFAAANNQAIIQATGRYVLLLNPDTVVLSDCLVKVVAWADSNPQAGIVGCKVLNGDGTLQRTCWKFHSLANQLLLSTFLYKVFPKSRIFGRAHFGHFSYDTPRQVDVVSGCFFLIRHEVVETVGLLDEAFFIYAEEVDYAYRGYQLDWRTWFTPVGEIIHHGEGSSRLVPVDTFLMRKCSELRFMYKHFGAFQAWIYNVLQIVFMGTRWPVWAVAQAVSHTDRARTKQRAYLAGLRKHVRFLRMKHLVAAVSLSDNSGDLSG